MKRCNEMYLRPTAMNIVENEEKMWMVLLNRNGICEIDKATRRARICKVFEGESLAKEFLYSNVEKVGDDLVFSPWDANNIAIYNLKSDSITYIPLKKIERKMKELSDGAKLWNIVRIQSVVYLLGYSYPAIVKIDMGSMEVEYITDWVEEVEKSIETGDNNGYFGSGSVIIGEKVFFPLGCMKALLELNMKTGNTRLQRLNVSMKGIGGIASADQENIWLVGKGDRTNWISCWNIRMNKVEEIQLGEEDGGIIDPFHPPICTDSTVFLMPISASCIYEMNIGTGEVMKCKTMEIRSGEKANSLWPYWKTMAPGLRKDKLVYLTGDDLEWHEYNVASGEFQSYYVSLEEETEETERYFSAVYAKMKKNNLILSELKIPLEYFMDEIGRADNQELYKERRYHFVGSKIYERMCGNT